MSDLGFRVEGNKAFVIRGDNEKEISRDTVIQVYQLLLSSISPNRDYTTITSTKKLLKTIDLECEPDDSDDESDPVVEAEKTAPVKTKKRGKSAKAKAVEPAPRDDNSEEE